MRDGDEANGKDFWQAVKGSKPELFSSKKPVCHFCYLLYS